MKRRKDKNNAHLTSGQETNGTQKLIMRKKAERKVSVPDIKQLK